MGRDYKKIVAWQRAHELTVTLYRVTNAFPRDELYGVTSQLRRAAYGVPSNIAEGSGRDTAKDYLRFLHIALASLKETEYFLLLSRDLGYIEKDTHELLTDQINAVFAPLTGLIKAVHKQASYR